MALLSCPKCGRATDVRGERTRSLACRGCRSLLLRDGGTLKHSGSAGRVVTSPRLRVGLRGRHRGRSFEILGRRQMQSGETVWNEWHLQLPGGEEGWLAEGEDFCTILYPTSVAAAPPDFDGIREGGGAVTLNGVAYAPDRKSEVTCLGSEGELPFAQVPGTVIRTVDLSGEGGLAATIEYAAGKVGVFVGEQTSLADLGLGASAEPRMQEAERSGARVKATPAIAIGRSGTIRGERVEVRGFMVRRVRVSGRNYDWREYFLDGPAGNRWLVEFDGHWVCVKPLEKSPGSAGKWVVHRGRTYPLFQAAKAEVVCVEGSFPWKAACGDVAFVQDYVAPPHILSSETEEGKTVWSEGEHVDPSEVWKGFGLSGSPIPRRGVGVAQPSAYGTPLRGLFLLFAGALLLLQFLGCALQANSSVHEESFVLPPGTTETARVTKVFDLGGRTSNVEIGVATNVRNRFAHFNGALIHAETGEAVHWSMTAQHYSGVEDGEAWTEGSADAAVVLGSVPAGKYYLLADPEFGGVLPGTPLPTDPFHFTVRVRRDIVRWGWFWGSLALLALPWIWCAWRRRAFEVRRWMESDTGEVP